MKLFRTNRGILVEESGRWYALAEEDWDQLLRLDNLADWLRSRIEGSNPRPVELDSLGIPAGTRAPILSQEVWAFGVTYYRSRDARMAESREAGGDDFYDRVYDASRPEFFFKSTPHRTSGHGEIVRIRKDSEWNVPEPELTLVVSPNARIIGYTIGNDMSSRDIEGANPLYLPQAKVYNQSCALGPCILVRESPLPPSTRIELEIRRKGVCVFEDGTELAQMKRDPKELVEYLFRDNSFPGGCFALTGTGIVPPEGFTLQPHDEIRISIEPIGTLVNTVVQN